MSEVSALIPTFRRPAMLRRAIVSAASQVGVKVRVRVFDNASGDETPDVVTELKRRFDGIEYRCHAQNIGAAANFLAVVEGIETPYFSLLSDDDYLLPGFYERAVAALESTPEAMLWAGVTLNVSPEGTIWDARMLSWPRDGLYRPPEGALLQAGGRAPTWTGIVFRSDVLRQTGFIDPRTLGPSDLDYTLRLGARHSFIVERVPVAVFTLNPSAFSAIQPLASFWPGWRQMFENIACEPALDPACRDQLLCALRRDGQRMLLRRGFNAVAHGRYQFSRDAADALIADYGAWLYAGVLRSMSIVASLAPPMQQVMAAAYGKLEQRIVASRHDLQHRFSQLLQPF